MAIWAKNRSVANLVPLACPAGAAAVVSEPFPRVTLDECSDVSLRVAGMIRSSEQRAKQFVDKRLGHECPVEVHIDGLATLTSA
jgi:hypothetical protein